MNGVLLHGDPMFSWKTDRDLSSLYRATPPVAAPRSFTEHCYFLGKESDGLSASSPALPEKFISPRRADLYFVRRSVIPSTRPRRARVDSGKYKFPRTNVSSVGTLSFFFSLSLFPSHPCADLRFPINRRGSEERLSCCLPS